MKKDANIKHRGPNDYLRMQDRTVFSPILVPKAFGAPWQFLERARKTILHIQ
ncbi:hypothetical protein NBG4_850004 [Candidatus Sulfobium mesophilum]|uniref:Uncharacterized protein n=1 Tax=Candidatus Sulfobium mesophilum TaxID=2016548 RepID=A0A2U3QKU7_9BACT|nr:hypothetical protein NBG4_850004 [Candidatus Sulfobium mesophilum]